MGWTWCNPSRSVNKLPYQLNHHRPIQLGRGRGGGGGRGLAITRTFLTYPQW